MPLLKLCSRGVSPITFTMLHLCSGRHGLLSDNDSSDHIICIAALSSSKMTLFFLFFLHLAESQ